MIHDVVHTPVLVKEAIDCLAPENKKLYVDATFGAGGYVREIFKRAPKAFVYGIDRDPDAILRGQSLEKEFPNFRIFKGNFSDLSQLMEGQFVEGIVFDLGVSSPQLDQAERGFSFQKDGPLDMRMSQEGMTAAQVVNSYGQEKLADIIWAYGDEPKARVIARKIVEERAKAPLQSTLDLARVVWHVLPRRPHQRIDPATKTFQALRIYINEELASLEKGLESAAETLKVGGRLVVVSFHSLEDRCVKSFFKRGKKGKENLSRYYPDLEKSASTPAYVMTTQNKKPIEPSEEEVKGNPRARSAKLRWGIKESCL